MVRTFAKTARERMRIDGGYRRDHLRALAQRVEVADGEVRIMGSKSDLLRTLTAISGVKSATLGVRSSVPKWRAGCDETGHWFLIVPAPPGRAKRGSPSAAGSNRGQEIAGPLEGAVL